MFCFFVNSGRESSSSQSVQLSITLFIYFITGTCPLTVSIPDHNLKEVSCTVASSCTSIACCVPVPLIDKNVEINVDIDTCELTMTLRVERLNYSLSLIDYEFGRKEYVWLSGVLRLT